MFERQWKGKAWILHIFFNVLFILSYLFLAALGLRCYVWAFFQLWRAGAALHCGMCASHCSGFSCCRARALGMRASVVVAHGLSSCGARALECRLSSCGAWAQLLCGIWDLPGPGFKSVSPVLAGRLLTTAPQGQPLNEKTYRCLLSIASAKTKLVLFYQITMSSLPHICRLLFELQRILQKSVSLLLWYLILGTICLWYPLLFLKLSLDYGTSMFLVLKF